ncbi:hypothetical protein [Fluviispira multicolorata]|uniref:Uncharacterized protein n=1 Tax=Fluviispira multicolorata TaxID=2654512 RepID=A0A833JDX3_9BACT|nr:hypothetical protein [Fluviispira multicolorata]KAB8032085.1 hypothetical protein GCL57_05410 [Fluviispira multicolorata]
MLKKTFIILSTIIATPAFSRESILPMTTTYVFCSSDKDRSQWRWAKDTNNNYVTATGYWKVIRRDEQIVYGINFDPFSFVFVTTSNEHIRIVKFCKKDESTQPADNSTSSWYSFSIS